MNTRRRSARNGETPTSSRSARTVSSAPSRTRKLWSSYFSRNRSLHRRCSSQSANEFSPVKQTMFFAVAAGTLITWIIHPTMPSTLLLLRQGSPLLSTSFDGQDGWQALGRGCLKLSNIQNINIVHLQFSAVSALLHHLRSAFIPQEISHPLPLSRLTAPHEKEI